MLKRFALAAIAALFMTSSASADIVITEIMKNPSAVNDSDGEWFEIHNTGGSAVDIDGWVIRDDGSDSHTIDNSGSLFIAAGGFLVLGRNSDTGTNGGVAVDYQYSSFFLGNGTDEVVIENSGGVEQDRVVYSDGAFPDTAGTSMELIDINSDNNVGSNWANSTTEIGSSGDFGTPGAANSVAVPEPASAAVLGLVAAAGLFVRRRK